MGWDYKNEAGFPVRKLPRTRTQTLMPKVHLPRETEEEDEDDVDENEIDTSDIWYKIISVDTDSFDAFEKLEQLVNEYISNTSDTFLPLGPPQYMDGYIVQTLVDVDNLDNK